MSIYSALSHFAEEWLATRADQRTNRIIRSLPLEVQKDIGWPDGYPTRSHKPTLGTWAGDR